MSSTHSIVIVGTQKGAVVRPATVLARRVDSLRFRNLTPMHCQLLVPRFAFFGNDGLDEVIAPGDELGPIAIDAGERRGAFPYQVYLFDAPGTRAALEEQRLFAIGESAPHVIIE